MAVDGKTSYRKIALAVAGAACLTPFTAMAEGAAKQPVVMTMTDDFSLERAASGSVNNTTTPQRLSVFPVGEASGSDINDSIEQKIAGRRVARRELIFQALNVIDAAQTISCLKRELCTEVNPLLGSNPSVGKLVAFKAAFGGGHYLITRLLADRAPGLLAEWQITSIAVQGEWSL